MYKKTLTTGCHAVLKWCFPPFKVSYATSISIVVPFESHVKKAMSYTFFSFTLICIGAYSFSNTTFPSSPSPYAPPVSKLLLLPLLLRRSPIASSSSSSSSSSPANATNRHAFVSFNFPTLTSHQAPFASLADASFAKFAFSFKGHKLR